MPSEIKIYTRNFLDRYSTISGDVYNANNAYLWDRDKGNKWKTLNANDDSLTIRLAITFNVSTTETEFIFNTLFLINTNLKDVLFEKWDGSAWVQIFQDEIPTGQTMRCWTFGNTKASRVRLSFTRTQKLNKDKEIGELIIARHRYTLANNPVTYNVHHRETKETIQLANGERHVAYTAFTGQRVSKYGASVAFEMVPEADLDFLECLKNEAAPFLWYPESDARTSEIYYVNWVNPFTASYTAQFKAVGFNINMELEEV